MPLLQPHYWSETDLVDNMLEEARGILDYKSFKTTYISAMKTFSRQSALGVKNLFDQVGRRRNSQLPPRLPVQVNKQDESSEDGSEHERPSASPKQGGTTEVSKGTDLTEITGSTSEVDYSKMASGPCKQLLNREEAKSAVSLPFVKCGTQLLSLSKDWLSTSQRTPMEVRLPRQLKK